VTRDEYEALAMDYSEGRLDWVGFRNAVVDALTREKEGENG